MLYKLLKSCQILKKKCNYIVLLVKLIFKNNVKVIGLLFEVIAKKTKTGFVEIECTVNCNIFS